MPLYEVEHIIPLTSDQKDLLASAITTIHSQLFTTPSLFVNVRFTNTANDESYIGGRRKSANKILAHVRPGGSRSTSDFNKLCKSVTEAWDQIVSDRAGYPRGGARELRAVFVLGTIIAGSEAGFELPPAGEDKEWLRENMQAFRQRAEGGDEDFKELMVEVRERDDLKQLL